MRRVIAPRLRREPCEVVRPAGIRDGRRSDALLRSAPYIGSASSARRSAAAGQASLSIARLVSRWRARRERVHAIEEIVFEIRCESRHPDAMCALDQCNRETASPQVGAHGERNRRARANQGSVGERDAVAGRAGAPTRPPGRQTGARQQPAASRVRPSGTAAAYRRQRPIPRKPSAVGTGTALVLRNPGQRQRLGKSLPQRGFQEPSGERFSWVGSRENRPRSLRRCCHSRSRASWPLARSLQRVAMVRASRRLGKERANAIPP